MNITQFEALLSSNASPNSQELGGLPVVREMLSSFVESVYADRIVDVLCQMGSDAYGDYIGFAMDVLRWNPHPLIVASVGQKLAASGISRSDAMSAQDVMLLRARETTTNLQSEMASECMAGAFLLASEVQASKPALIAALDRVEPGDNALLVRRVSLLAGLAWFWSGSEDVETTLRRLSDDADAGEQAAFELGMIQIDYALSSQDKESLFARLGDAVTWFDAAERIEPEMLEATAVRGALRALISFCDGAPATTVEQHLREACNAASERFHYLDSVSMRKWLRPRLDVQTTWYELSCALQGLTEHMTKRSWLRALPVLEQIANLRSTLVRLATKSGDTLRSEVTDRLALGFAAREGLRAHLQAWAEDLATEKSHRDDALAMLAAVERMRADQGKAGPLASEDGLASGDRLDDKVVQRAGYLLSAQSAAPLNEKQEQGFLQITTVLQKHEDYGGKFQRDIDVFVIFLIRFLSYCLDVGYEMGKTSVPFLFRLGSDKPLEQELQEAMFTWLTLVVWGFKSHQVRREVPDVASGRADLAITTEAGALYAELKREMSDASRAGLTKYLGQAATYQLTTARISFLVVLDLCLQQKWTLTLQDNCWVESVQTPEDSGPRMVVVFRIPGMRPVPSSVVTPSSGARAKRGGRNSTAKAAKAQAQTTQAAPKRKAARTRAKAPSTASS